jgi:hypothetical protein
MSSGNNESDNPIVKRDERRESDYFQTDKGEFVVKAA